MRATGGSLPEELTAALVVQCSFGRLDGDCPSGAPTVEVKSRADGQHPRLAAICSERSTARAEIAATTCATTGLGQLIVDNDIRAATLSTR